MQEEIRRSKPRGFAAISPERRREIAKLGGAAVPAEKRSFSKNPGLAASSGRLGGKISSLNKKARKKIRAM